jgi:hypothetical protein
MIVIETPAQRPSVVRSQQASDCQCFHTARSCGSLIRSPLCFVETPSNTDATVPWCVGVETIGLRWLRGLCPERHGQRRHRRYACRSHGATCAILRPRGAPVGLPSMTSPPVSEAIRSLVQRL